MNEGKKLGQIMPQIMGHFFRLTQGFNCPSELTIAQFKLLKSLYLAKKPLKMSELSSALGLAHSTVTDIVKKLIQMDYLDRRRCEKDDRVVLLSLKNKGVAVVDDHLKAISDFFVDLCKKLKPKDRELLLACHEEILRIYQQLDGNKNAKDKIRFSLHSDDYFDLRPIG
ncbi:MAG: MarR family winged helix-turn-helix transcriptional regulator [Bacteriovoracia bacterium]